MYIQTITYTLCIKAVCLIVLLAMTWDKIVIPIWTQAHEG